MLMTDKSSKRSCIGGWTERDLELMSECRLWKYVMCQAISDLYLGSPKQKLSVAQWIATQDFIDVCDMAELNSSKIKPHLHKIATSKPVVARYLGERLKRVIQNRSLFH